jgi:hypothetical protein
LWDQAERFPLVFAQVGGLRFKITPPGLRLAIPMRSAGVEPFRLPIPRLPLPLSLDRIFQQRSVVRLAHIKKHWSR